MTEADLLNALVAAVSPDAIVERPRGFYTASELARKSRQDESTVRRRLRALASEGKVEAVRIRVPRADGSMQPTTAYKLKAA